MIDIKKTQNPNNNNYDVHITGWSLAACATIIFLLGVGLGHILTA